MSQKIWMAAALAFVLTAPAAFADFSDTSSEVTASTPDITPHSDNPAYLGAGENTTVQRSSTTYTTTIRRSGQSQMGDEHVFRPYRTYTKVIEGTPLVTTHTSSVTYDPQPVDAELSLEREADLLVNSLGEAPVTTETTIIRQ